MRAASGRLGLSVLLVPLGSLADSALLVACDSVSVYTRSAYQHQCQLEKTRLKIVWARVPARCLMLDSAECHVGGQANGIKTIGGNDRRDQRHESQKSRQPS